MQINRFTKIVIFVTSLGFTFLSCIALLIFLFCLALLLLLLCSLECAGVFRLCGGDLVGLLAPLKTSSPAGLSWTSLWVRCYFCLANLALLPPRLLSSGSHLIWARPPKNKKLRVKTKGCCRNALRQPQFNYSFSRRSFFVCGTLKSTNAPIIVNIISGSIYAPL